VPRWAPNQTSRYTLGMYVAVHRGSAVYGQTGSEAKRPPPPSPSSPSKSDEKGKKCRHSLQSSIDGSRRPRRARARPAPAPLPDHHHAEAAAQARHARSPPPRTAMDPSNAASESLNPSSSFRFRPPRRGVAGRARQGRRRLRGTALGEARGAGAGEAGRAGGFCPGCE
jgi:hypothetical protein